ncbi:Oidioi.mRNA.OKI2018_I69.XSR.g16504.t1.cds [Oikopleura dioica]|uniref:Oidioi.mRNA.OKI2018_I69.XSR.g16504.t1.cds n=1 Tax=Oikopleura dioica TaxID=34765 RepID=A0ABN7SGB2_OIKDI|nr:Oidioi.mRNA.OKI2018_I69.XSR.g16504.t1.cds [Oikopleura dioica]
MTKSKDESIALKFGLGLVAGQISIFWVHPFDLIKNRLQTSGASLSPISCVGQIVKEKGIRGFYDGFSASMMRQATYTTGRLGIYSNLLHQYKVSTGVQKPNLFWTTLMGSTSGGLAAIIGNPADVAIVRMTVDSKLPIEQRRNYTSVFNAWARIVKEEGVRKLWVGCRPTVARAMVVNSCQLSFNTQTRYFIEGKVPSINPYLLSILSSCCSGLLTTTIVLPIDFAKTRIQNAKGHQYSGWLDVWRKTVKNEGFAVLWKGFGPYFARTPITLFIMDILLYQFGMSR